MLKTKENKSDFENAYSRQLGTYGMETMGKLIQMEVAILGLRGVGIETAKNLILAGPKKVHIYDETIVRITDLGSNFFLNDTDVGKKRRDEASLDKLKELNPRCEVEIIKFNPFGEMSINLLSEYNVVVLTEVRRRSDVERIDEVMRRTKGGFIYSAALGLSGYVFSDFGEKFDIKDNNGEECKKHIIKDISNSSEGIVMIDDALGRLSYEDGDYVVFKEVKGMTELNDSYPRRIRYISPFAFGIDDTSGLGKYERGGIVEQVKVPKTMSYRSFKDSFDCPYTTSSPIPDLTDFSKIGRNEIIHVGVQAVHKYFEENGKLPIQNDIASINSLLQSTSEEFKAIRSNEDVFWIQNAHEYDEEIIKKILTWSASSIVPVTSFLGGIVAQEIIKFTGKYTPINQWMWFDFFESIANIPSAVDRSSKGTRYDDQINIIGYDLQNKLMNMNIFLVGAGALGCEFLKEFALMGISCGKGVTTVTDNDHIEISNLNRQFLFRMNDVKKPKSAIAAKAAIAFNSSFNVKDLQALVSIENEDKFNDKFWKGQDFIINAVDNIKARKYIDSKCTFYNIPLVDSGTLGTKAHSQMIFPHVTSCYNDKQDPVEDSIPMCTLHNFPSMIEHCIEYGRDSFTGNFTDSIAEFEKFMKEPNSFLSDLRKETQNTSVQLVKLNSLLSYIDIKSKNSFDECIKFAFNAFVSLFDHKIQQLLHNFPADFRNSDGTLFWVGSKRVPSPIGFNINDELTMMYIISYSILLAQALGIDCKSEDYIKEYSKSLKTPIFKPSNIRIKVNDNENDVVPSEQSEEESVLKVFEETKGAYLKIGSSLASSSIHPHEFEKDDDTNYHIDYMHACSNLRARNYSISECDRLKTKLIAGKIVPAIATTTAAITGLVALQIITGLSTSKIDYMRDGYINLGMNIFLMTEPGPKVAIKDKDFDVIVQAPIKAIPSGFSIWDKIEINGSKTIKQIIDYYDKEYDCEVSIIAVNGITLYMCFTPAHKERLGFTIEDLYEKYSNKKILEDYLIIEVSCDTKDGAVALMPTTIYRFK